METEPLPGRTEPGEPEAPIDDVEVATLPVAVVPRGGDGRFVPGQSGNPTGLLGRRLGKNLVTKIREETGDGEELADWLLKVWRREIIPTRAQHEAARELLDRGFGTPLKQVAILSKKESVFVRSPEEQKAKELEAHEYLKRQAVNPKAPGQG